VDISLSLDNPVVTGDSGIENPLLDVPGHFLGSNQQTLNLLIVDLWIIRSRRKRNVVTRSLKKLCGGILEAAGWDPQLENPIGHESLNPAELKKKRETPQARGHSTQARIPEQLRQISLKFTDLLTSLPGAERHAPARNSGFFTRQREP